MRISGILILCVLLLTPGCSLLRRASAPVDQPASFAPVAMRIHPIFTRVKDWTGDNYPDGIDALIEFQDQLGDPTKASGRVIFEVYSFQKYDPQRKGRRLVNPWIGSLETTDDQRLRWNRTSRTYGFPLQFDQVSLNQSYVLTAQFQLTNGGRFYDEIVLEPPQGAYAARGTQVPTTSMSEGVLSPTSAPSTAPYIAPANSATRAPTTQPTSQP